MEIKIDKFQCTSEEIRYCEGKVLDCIRRYSFMYNVVNTGNFLIIADGNGAVSNFGDANMPVELVPLLLERMKPIVEEMVGIIKQRSEVKP